MIPLASRKKRANPKDFQRPALGSVDVSLIAALPVKIAPDKPRPTTCGDLSTALPALSDPTPIPGDRHEKGETRYGTILTDNPLG